MSDEYLSGAKLEEIAERALAFQRYVYRRAWGTYYAVWSAAFLAFVFGGELPLGSLVPQSQSWVPYALLYGGVGWGAGLVTAWIFKNAFRTISLREVTGGYRRMDQSMGVVFWVWSIGFYVVALISFVYFQREAFSILFALLFSVEVIIYFTLKLSFQKAIPFEGRLALASYGACVVFSFFTSLFTPEFLLVGSVWGLTIAVWLFCALYALGHAPDELVELHH